MSSFPWDTVPIFKALEQQIDVRDFWDGRIYFKILFFFFLVVSTGIPNASCGQSFIFLHPRSFPHLLRR